MISSFPNSEDKNIFANTQQYKIFTSLCLIPVFDLIDLNSEVHALEGHHKVRVIVWVDSETLDNKNIYCVRHGIIVLFFEVYFH